jgi:hypothetical protein
LQSKIVGETRILGGGFIEIVSWNQRLLVKPAPTFIAVNLPDTIGFFGCA